VGIAAHLTRIMGFVKKFEFKEWIEIMKYLLDIPDARIWFDRQFHKFN
jgi:hypothetical protein